MTRSGDFSSARVTAVLELTWDRVDFERGQVNLRTGEGQRKGRAIVPMTESLYAALVNAQKAALSDYVVEWAGGPIAVIDCFGILDDKKIRRYFELNCEVKGLGRGHVKRIKDRVACRRPASCTWR